jgi:3-hydroxymyristoyl/3-hydroxydecanoyl-(acyl carrier protein) dehydratase
MELSSEFAFGTPERDGDKATVTFAVPHDLRYVDGHFPGSPIVPGVAQLVPVAEAQARRVWPELGPARGVRRLKFMHALRPGDELVLTLERAEGQVRFRIERGASTCSKGALLFS